MDFQPRSIRMSMVTKIRAVAAYNRKYSHSCSTLEYDEVNEVKSKSCRGSPEMARPKTSRHRCRAQKWIPLSPAAAPIRLKIDVWLALRPFTLHHVRFAAKLSAFLVHVIASPTAKMLYEMIGIVRTAHIALESLDKGLLT